MLRRHLMSAPAGHPSAADVARPRTQSVGGTSTNRRVEAAARALLVGLGLAAVVALRWQIFRTQTLDGVSEGLVFALGLCAVAWLGWVRPAVPRLESLVAGAGIGAALVASSLLARWPAQPLPLGHAAPFLPWAAVTTLVATAEELVLRGGLWRWVSAAGGDAAALVLTSVLFALIHVPIYGWAVVPLDLGVGLCFGALRLWFGGPAAPATAHVVADLATWWL